MSQFGTKISAEADKSMEVEGIINAGVATADQVPGGAEPGHVEEDIAPIEGTQHLPSEDADMAERTPDKPDMPAEPAAQQEHEPPSKPIYPRPARPEPGVPLLHVDRQASPDRGAAGQLRQRHGQGRDRRQPVGLGGAGDHEDVLRLGGRQRHDAGL